MKKLSCMNCDTEVDPDKAQIFAGVFCCPECFLCATRLDERMARELDALKLMGREAIRISLANGKLHFGEQKVDELRGKSSIDGDALNAQIDMAVGELRHRLGIAKGSER